MRMLLIPLALHLVLTQASLGQQVDRRTKVLQDRERFAQASDWIYNDLAAGIKAAETARKPLFVVIRCIPCENCQDFDDDVAQRDPIIRQLMDQFICVRIPMANTLDLTHFQYDFDQSFVVFLMHPDMTIYARYGTRSERPETEDISLEGLRAAMTEALRLFPNHEAVKPLLAGKQVRPGRFRVPTEYPVLTRYKDRLDYEGAVVQSCLHCHQIRDAERTWYRSRNERMPDEVVFPYPDPEVLGLRLDPKGMTRVAGVEPGSTGERAGFKKGDEIKTLAGQPLYSTADLQWVLQHAPDRGQLEAEVVRGGEPRPVTVTLEEGWRRRGNISWRVSTWNLRRMGFGGMVLEDLSDEQRRAAQLPAEAMAFRVKHVGQFGDHAVAKKAGFLVGDIIRSFDGLNRRMSESQLLAYTMQEKRAGDSVILKVERGGKEETLKLTLPPAGTNPG